MIKKRDNDSKHIIFLFYEKIVILYKKIKKLIYQNQFDK